jgi:hypothetical protein
MYTCPYCGGILSSWEVETVDRFHGDLENQEREFDCRHCKRPVKVTAEVSATFEISAAKTVAEDGDEVPDMAVDMAAVMAHFRKKPNELHLFAFDLPCEQCGRKANDRSLRTAADYLAAGWRVAPEFPSARVTCPACIGEVSHAA